MSNEALAGLVAMLALAAGGLALILTRTGRRRACPGCGRARVPRRRACPFCGTSYELKTAHTRFDRSPSPPLGAAPQLVCIQGPYRGRSFPIGSSEFSIGRGADSRLRLEGGLVSRHHALVTLQNGQYILYDRDSTNGTWLNGQPVSQQPLQPGDQLQIGPFVFVFQGAGTVLSPPSVIQPVERIHTPAPVSAGTAQFGDYELLERIGGGGMATVYKARSRLDGSFVAIKVYHRTNDPYLSDGREIRVGMVLSEPPHPHIARVLGGGSSGGVHFMVMEFVDHGSLRERLQPGRPTNPEFITPIIGQTCDALSYAHLNRIFHRDIKPENILFSSRDGVKLVDFGIAKQATQVTHTMDGVIIGTPYYLSYEQAHGMPVDGRSDLYSLGVVLYEMLTGRPPFIGEPLAVVHKHIHEEPLRPSQINPSVPAHLEEAALRALAKNADMRFQSAEEFARAVGYQAGFSRPGAQPAVSAPEVLGARLRRAMGVQRWLRKLRPGRPRPARPRARAGAVRLVVEATGRPLPLAGAATILCRRNLNPGDRLISRERHAQIVRYGGQYWLQDLGSTNGTYLEGRRIFEPALLRPGDRLRLGQTELRFEQARR